MARSVRAGLVPLARAGLDLLYPPRCVLCERLLDPADGPWLCGPDGARWRPAKPPWCPRCGLPVPVRPETHCASCRARRPRFAAARAASLYSGAARDLVRRLKFERRAHAAYPLVDAMAALARAEGWDRAADLVAAVPLHPRKRRERGFNQAEALARGVAASLGLPYRELLRRTKDTPPQGAAETRSRERNVEGAFEVRRSPFRLRTVLEGRTLIVVDDVTTSGATVSECSRVLRRAGAARVFALAAARGGVPGEEVTPSPRSPRGPAS